MAGFLALVRGPSRARSCALAPFLALSASVMGAATNAAPTPPSAPTAAAAAAKGGKPALPEDVYLRYGTILTPGNEPAHPLKLAPTSFAEMGQVKIPSPQEIDMRDKLEHLASLSDEDIRQDLEKWPPYSKMSLADEGMILVRIQQFKDRRSKIAQERAHVLGLLTLKPEQVAQFEKEYWDKRLQMDRDLAKQFQPVFKAHEMQIEEQLYREFSTPGKPIPPPPAKPATNVVTGVLQAPVPSPAPPVH